MASGSLHVAKLKSMWRLSHDKFAQDGHGDYCRPTFSGLLAAQDQEKKINRSDLPLAVQKTVATQSAGASVRGFSQEKENGKTFYEAELLVNGHSKDVLMDANGEVIEVEEQVPIDQLPTVVRDGLAIESRPRQTREG